MKKKHREMLRELQSIGNALGGTLDRTSTHDSKLWDRQKAHMLVSNVLYGILVDHSENESAKEDMEKAETSLETLRQLIAKVYPDKKGNV